MEYRKNDAATIRRSANPYTDHYTGFSWNNHHSSEFNCFIENTGHLTFEPAPDFSNSSVTPAFYNGSIFTGVQTNSKKVQLNLIFYRLTLADFNQALRWLDRHVISDFLFDYNVNYKYQCKIASLGVTEKYIDGYCIIENQKQDLYICRMQITLETIDIHNAINTYTHTQFIMGTTNFNIDNSLGSLPIYFRLHLINVSQSHVIVYLKRPTTADFIRIPIIMLDLNLDPNIPITLHYDSKTGAITTVNQLLNSVENGVGQLICKYCDSKSQIVAPGESLLFDVDGCTNFIVEYDLQDYVI